MAPRMARLNWTSGRKTLKWYKSLALLVTRPENNFLSRQIRLVHLLLEHFPTTGAGSGNIKRVGIF